MYFVIVKHNNIPLVEYSLCPLDDTGALSTAYKNKAELKALNNKACNPTCDYYVVAIDSSAELNPAPKYHMVKKVY